MNKEEETVKNKSLLATQTNAEEIVDDEPNAHNPHRSIMRYGRSPRRFDNSMKGNK